MRWSPGCVIVCAVAASAVLLTGCSSGKRPVPSGSPKPSTSTPQAAGPTGPVQVGVSPGGVTTSISAPAGDTEDEYFQACHWARVWMSGQQGDPHTLVEPYLAMVQKSPTGENGTWHVPWAKLSPERQAGVIIAVQAAADGGCD